MPMDHDPRFSDFALAWGYHRNSSRWAHNAQETAGTDDVPEPGREDPTRPFTALPDPRPVTAGLDSLLERRCSCRDFADTPIGMSDLSSVLHHGYGVLGQDHWNAAEFLERPVPSGGGMYPLELSVMARNVSDLADGIYHYQPLLSGLEQMRELRVPDQLMRYLFMGQYPLAPAAAVIVISAWVGRSMKKYGDRGYRYILLEAGHVAQNINLACVGLGLQSLNIGGYFDDELARLCCCNEDDEIVVYAIAVGNGVGSSKHLLRFSEDD